MTLFQRLARLYTLGVKAIFVFDGPNKPLVKRNRQWYSGFTASDSEITFRRLLELFGFKSWEAAGEAEAECAKLLDLGIVDLVVTDDVDALMFGAKKMITNWQNDYVSFFDMKTINEQLELDQDGLVLIGLLAGNDYVTSGSRNIGILTAVGLAKAGLAPKVIYAKTVLQKEEARKALISELKTNASGKLDRKRPSAAKVLPDEFPEPEVVELLRNPKCRARSLTSPEGVAQLSHFVDPDFTELGAYVQNLFHMPIADIYEKLVSLVFPGYALQCVKSEMRSGSQLKLNSIETTPSKQTSHTTKKKSDITSYFAVSKKASAPSSPTKAASVPATFSTNIICINRERQPMDAKTCHVKEYQVQINPACMLQFLKLVSKKLCYYPPLSPSFHRQATFAVPKSISPHVRQQPTTPDAWRTPVRNSGLLSSPDSSSEASDDEEHNTWKYRKIDRPELPNTPRSKSIASSIQAGEENPELKEIKSWSKVNRQWIDSTIIQKAYPKIVREYEDKKNAKASRKRQRRSNVAKGKAPSSKLLPGQRTITEMVFGIQAADGTIDLTQDEGVSASVVGKEDMENPFLVQDESNLNGKSSDMHAMASLVIPKRRKRFVRKSQSKKSHSDVSLKSADSDSDSESILSIIEKQSRSIMKI